MKTNEKMIASWIHFSRQIGGFYFPSQEEKKGKPGKWSK